MFCPVRYPACRLQMKAQNAPNSSGVPKRLAGLCMRRASRTSSMLLPAAFADEASVAANLSVSNGPGNRLLIVTLCATVLRANPATKPVRPERAPLDRPRISIGAFTALDVILTMRPKPRAIMPSTTALISSTKEEFIAHEARTCIAEGEILANPRRVKRFSEQQCFKTQAEMAGRFADMT